MVQWLLYAVVIFMIYKMVTSGQSKGHLPSKRTSPSPYDVLGVARDANQQQIKRAYQQKMREYHPDRVAGAAKEIQQLAEKRAKELNAAYEQLREREPD